MGKQFRQSIRLIRDSSRRNPSKFAFRSVRDRSTVGRCVGTSSTGKTTSSSIHRIDTHRPRVVSTASRASSTDAHTFGHFRSRAPTRPKIRFPSTETTARFITPWFQSSRRVVRDDVPHRDASSSSSSSSFSNPEPASSRSPPARSTPTSSNSLSKSSCANAIKSKQFRDSCSFNVENCWTSFVKKGNAVCVCVRFPFSG